MSTWVHSHFRLMFSLSSYTDMFSLSYTHMFSLSSYTHMFSLSYTHMFSLSSYTDMFSLSSYTDMFSLSSKRRTDSTIAKWKKRKDLSTKHNPEIKIHQHAGNLDVLMCSRRISNYCSSTSGTQYVLIVLYRYVLIVFLYRYVLIALLYTYVLIVLYRYVLIVLLYTLFVFLSSIVLRSFFELRL
jgi:hypothetical protein